MTGNKKLIPSLGITLGVVGLTANALALTYCSSLSPLIVGGMIGSRCVCDYWCSFSCG